MAKELPPYVNATGTLKNVLEKIKQASTPSRFTQDYIVTKLGFSKSGSTLAVIPYLKKIGFLGSDGVPTELYEKFRNPNETKAGIAIAKAMKIGYADLYERNEYFHELDKGELKSFLVEATGADPKNRAVSSIVNSIDVLKTFARFDHNEDETASTPRREVEKVTMAQSQPVTASPKERELNISYTINLNLPETSDITVFDAIFKSLKEHILDNES